MSHVVPMTVRFADLDPWGHVNHARYLSYFESARVELLEEIGYGIMAMGAGGRQIVLVEASVRYFLACGLHDVLDISTCVTAMGRATSHWRQEASRGEDLAATLEIRAAFTDLDGRPARPPEGFAAAIAPYRAGS